MQNKYVIGIDVGGTKVAYGLFDAEGVLVERMEHLTDTDADGPGFCDGLIRNVHALMERRQLSLSVLAGIGIGMPSFILFDEGRILMTSAITGIKDFAMRDYLQERLPTRIVLDNDANAAALAEHRKGAGRGSKHMVYMVLGTGIGSGIIIDRKLFRGSYGWAGECGHMIATPDQGMLCGCENRGCYMSYASGAFIPAHIKKRLMEGFVSGPVSELTNESDAQHLLEACHHGDALAIEIVEQMAQYIALCVFNMYQMLNINTFVFGGGLVNFGETLFGRVRSTFDRYNHIPLPVHFKMAELEKDFGIIGAAEFVREASI